MRLMITECTSEKTKKKRKSHESTKNCNLDDLPLEILANILSRLPVKSILRCMAVSKPFNPVISDNSMYGFSSIYRSNNNNPYSVTALAYRKTSTPLSLIDIDRATSVSSEATLPAPLGDAPPDCEYFTVHGNCDGLVCLLKGRRGYFNLFLGNPTLGQFIQLPQPVPFRTDRFIAYGLGYCGFSSKYKVLRIITDVRYNDYRNTTQIFTVGLDKEWRAVLDPNVPYNMLTRIMGSPNFQNQMTAFNSRLHWFVHPVTQSRFNIEPKWGGRRYICAFDLKEEKVNAIPLAPEMDTTRERYGRLGTLSDKLCLFKLLDCGDLDVWVMLDYAIEASWTKQFSFQTSSIPACSGLPGLGPVAISNQGVMILEGDYYHWIVFYDLIRNHTLLVFHTENSYRDLLNYTPSFVPLKDIVDVL